MNIENLGVSLVRSKLGLYGKNIKVAVIDTGVYYLHPALGGCFGNGCKVSFGYDFVGDSYDYLTQSIVPDSDPIDNCSDISHGTHVAGIIAAVANLQKGPFATQINFTGVAPEVTLGLHCFVTRSLHFNIIYYSSEISLQVLTEFSDVLLILLEVML